MVTPCKLVYFWVSAASILSSIPCVNSYPLVLNVSFNITFLKVIFFIISHSLQYHLYLPYDLFLNESMLITFNNFLLLTMVNVLIIWRTGWKIAAEIEKWIIAVSINKQMVQNMMEDTTEWILQQFSWMLQWISECCNKWELLWYFFIFSAIP